MADIEEPIHPDILKAVDRAIDRRLKGMNVVDLKECREKLEATQHALIDMQTNFELWQNLAKVHKQQNEKLQGELTEMNAQIALLRSVLENRASEVTPEDDGAGD